MSGQDGAAPSRGIGRVWRLVAEGYRITDVDSDELFVGVRMERQEECITLLLTREDFAMLFPNAATVLLPFAEMEDKGDLLADR